MQVYLVPCRALFSPGSGVISVVFAFEGKTNTLLEAG